MQLDILYTIGYLSIVGIAASISMFYDSKSNNKPIGEIFACLLPLNFTLVGFIIGIIFNFYSIIKIDIHIGIIIIKIRHFFVLIKQKHLK